MTGGANGIEIDAGPTEAEYQTKLKEWLDYLHNLSHAPFFRLGFVEAFSRAPFRYDLKMSVPDPENPGKVITWDRDLCSTFYELGRLLGGAARDRGMQWLHPRYNPIPDDLFTLLLEVIDFNFPRGIMIRREPIAFTAIETMIERTY